MTIMIRISLFVALVLMLYGLSYSGVSDQQARFFAGVFLLQSQNGLSQAEKARRFHELEAVSGVTAAEARKQLRSLREKPQEWRHLNEVIFHFVKEYRAVTDSAAAQQRAPVSPAAARR